MSPDNPEIKISDVVMTTAGRDQGQIFFVVKVDSPYLMLANGKDRPLEKPKRKKLRHVRSVLPPETRVATKLLAGDKVLNSELRKDLAYISQELQSNALGG